MKPTKNPYAIALTATLGMILGVLNTTLINIALVPISKDLNVELSTAQWLITGYLLAQAAVIPVSGYLSNRFGAKQVYLVCIALFTLGSILCSVTQDVTWLIIFRAIQGLGGGGILPVGMVLALDPFPAHKRASAMSIVALPTLLAPIIGPILGGWLNDAFGWHSLFLINVPIGLIALALTWKVIPLEKHQESVGGFDLAGLVLSIAGILAVVYAFTVVNQTDPATKTAANPTGTAYGWGYWLFWTLAGVGVALLAVFAVYELKFTRNPVLDLRQFKNYNFTISNIVNWALTVVMYGVLLLLPIFFQRVRLPHLSAFDSGLALAPEGVGMLVGIVICGALVNRIGARLPVMLGVALIAVGMWQFSQLTPTTDGWALLPWTITAGLGIGMAMMPVQTLALQHLSGAALAEGTALFNATRQIFSSLGTAVITSLLVQQGTTHGQELQQAALRQLPPGTKLDPTSPQAQAAIEQIKAQAGTAANNDLFSYLMIGAIVVIVLALLMPGRQKTSQAETVEAELATAEEISTGYAPELERAG